MAQEYLKIKKMQHKIMLRDEYKKKYPNTVFDIEELEVNDNNLEGTNIYQIIEYFQSLISFMKNI
ncbi:hypothetical protein HC864_05510 [Candidatus Gracilibacteria bacterium]|nr:hypothetical protein [Candidatus Gracilibacteria bacterium]